MTLMADVRGERVTDSRAAVVNKEAARIHCYALLALFDILALCLAFGSAAVLVSAVTDSRVLVDQARTMLSAIIPLYLLQAALISAYGVPAIERLRYSVKQALTGLATAAGAVLFIGYFLKASGEFSRGLFITGMAMSFVMIAAGRATLRGPMLRMLNGSAHMVVVIRDNVPYVQQQGEVVLDAAQLNFDPMSADPHEYHLLASAIAQADRILIATTPARALAWTSTLRSLTVDGEIFTDVFDELGAISLRTFGERRTVVVTTGPLGLKSRAIKRLFDLSLSIAGLLVLMPVLIATALAVRWESRGPVFFCQQRVGRDNKIFWIYKFRSMYTDLADASGHQLTTKRDNRVTRVGRFIRRTSIDELPQLLNVLKGDMSIVGPRPHALAAKAGDILYWNADARYRHRHAIKPGLTGLAQVRGFRGNTLLLEDLTNRVHADLEYAANWSLPRDIAIIFRTLGVLVDKNAY